MMEPDRRWAKLLARLPLYVSVGWGLVMLFALVGNCAGKVEGSAIVAAITAVVWTCSRILKEAFEALAILRAAHDHDVGERPPRP